MSNQLEFDWLTEARPTPLPLDPATTDRVRTQLLAHATSTRNGRAGWRLGALRPRALRVAAGGATLAALGSAALMVAQPAAPTRGLGASGGSALNSVFSVQSASAKELRQLSARVASAPTPTGDATLVLRTSSYPNGSSVTGADLYADNGNYYYAPAFSGLAATIQAGQTVNLGAADQQQRDIAAAQAALTGPIEAARQQMAVANLDPNLKSQSVVTPSGILANVAKLPAVLRAALEQKLAQVAHNAAADNVHSLISQQNGMIWDNSMDALLAGAGNPQVRAGVLQLLATIPQITVTQGTLGGQATVVISARLFSSNQGVYQEQLILDAGTGIPVQFIGGNVGQTPGVVTSYRISRVSTAAIENGSYAG